MNKFNAKKCHYKGQIFDSKKEMNRYIELEQMEKQGIIRSLARQIRWTVLDSNEYFRQIDYISDFSYYNNLTKESVVEDVKGYRKGAAYQVFKIKQKLMYNRYKILIREI